MEKKEVENIELQGVRTHNLKIDRVLFPLGRMTVVTGLSGSGKSSLVFDTLYSESYRRYVENLSSFARQYLKTFPKPELDSCRNLPPSIAIKQHQGASGGYNNRSTVGSLTELTDFLRILFTHLGDVYCHQCGQLVRTWNVEEIVDHLFAQGKGGHFLILAPLERYQSLAPEKLAEDLMAQGFSRVLVQGEIKRISECLSSTAFHPTKWSLKDTLLVVDRIRVDLSEKNRLYEALELALRVGQSHLLIEFDSELAKGGIRRSYGREPRCFDCQRTYQSPSLALLSYNHPVGACEQCQGFGQVSEIDWSKVIPQKESSLAQEGVAPWNFGQFKEYYVWAREQIAQLSKLKIVDKKEIEQPKKSSKSKKNTGNSTVLSENLYIKKFSAYTPEEWQWLREGSGRSFDGVNGFFRYLESKKYKPHYRIHLARFRRYARCPGCFGDRLSADALAIKLGGLNIAEVHRLSLEKIGSWTQSICRDKVRSKGSQATRSQDDHLMGVQEALEETESRIGFLLRLGLTYLTLDRTAKSLSGGELQRIHLGRCLGSALEDTLYCLDEPTTGLHPRDSQKLLGVVRELLRGMNTVVMVEHDTTLLQGADHVIEVGPKAGADGGQIVFEGVPKNWRPTSVVSSQKADDQRQRQSTKRFVTLSQGSTHNLKNVTIRIPLGQLTVICGVSGSGKTSLIEHCLYPALKKVLEGRGEEGSVAPKARVLSSPSALSAEEGAAFDLPPGTALLEPLSFVRDHRGVMLVSQGALSRSSRSNIATYLGIMDELRKLMAQQPEAKKLNLGPSAFSFNTAGGRCETCKGLGLVVEDLSFLGEVEVICPACQGKRFSDQVLSVTYKNLSLNQIFELTVRQARDFFADRPGIRQICDRVVGMGLGYLSLGQSTSSFSGGEAQRLKLLSILAEDMDDSRPMFLIFDEPTRGLSRADVEIFLENLRSLTLRGHCVVVVEHHVDVMRAADWLIEVGPEAADKGGEIVYMGSVRDFQKNCPPNSATWPFVSNSESM